MALWKEQPAPRKDDIVPIVPIAAPEPVIARVPDAVVEPRPSYSNPMTQPIRDAKEALITTELTIEGKIEGSGNVRIAGKFKGEVNVQGNLSIEPGAKLTGTVKANTISIGGELEGNITGADKVDLLSSGVLNGDLKAGSLTVAAGSKMRGQVEFGWDVNERKGGSSHS